MTAGGLARLRLALRAGSAVACAWLLALSWSLRLAAWRAAFLAACGAWLLAAGWHAACCAAAWHRLPPPYEPGQHPGEE